MTFSYDYLTVLPSNKRINHWLKAIKVNKPLLSGGWRYTFPLVMTWVHLFKTCSGEPLIVRRKPFCFIWLMTMEDSSCLENEVSNFFGYFARYLRVDDWTFRQNWIKVLSAKLPPMISDSFQRVQCSIRSTKQNVTFFVLCFLLFTSSSKWARLLSIATFNKERNVGDWRAECLSLIIVLASKSFSSYQRWEHSSMSV